MATEFTKHIPCPCGKSSDAFSIYQDKEKRIETYTCFSCGDEDIPSQFHAMYYSSSKKDVEKLVTDYLNKEDYMQKPSEKKTVWQHGLIADIKDRKISKDVVKLYKVRQYKHSNGNLSILFPFYNSKGNIISYKQKTVIPSSDDLYSTHGNFKQAVLFGQNIFPKGSSKYITITEGELDAMSAYQLSGGAGPAVSLKNGANSVEAALKNKDIYEYLNSFETIVVCFDNDEQGKKAADKFAKSFEYNKVKVMKLAPEFKDANDYLKAGKLKEFQKAFWDAEKYSPSNIIDMSSESFRQKAFFSEKSDVVCYDYPYKTLNDMTYGARMGEMVVVWADEKVGKSQFLKELEYHFRKTTKFPIGLLHFEESDVFIAKVFSGIELNCPIYLPPFKDKFSAEEQAKAFDKINKDMHLYAQFGSKNINDVVDAVQFLVKGVGCKFIFLDHINMITSDQRYADERVALDEVSTKLKTKTVEWDFNLHMVAHANRQDQIRGTGNIDKLANVVIKLERDKLEPDEEKRNTTSIFITNNRFGGQTGPAGFLYYDKNTGRLTEIDSTSEFSVEK